MVDASKASQKSWTEKGTPTQIRNQYRLRFGIEIELSANATGAHLHLHAQSPPAAVLYCRGIDLAQLVGVDSCHQTRLRPYNELTLHLECLRFKRMLELIVTEIFNLYHEGTTPSVTNASSMQNSNY